MSKRSTSAGTGRFSRVRARQLRRATVVLSVLGLAGTTAACGSNARPADVKGHESAGQPTSLTWEIDEPWEKLTSVSAGAGPEGTVLLATEPLILLEPNGTFRPNLGTEVPQTNPKTVVFKLRPGVKFWDGHPLRPQDVVWSLDQNLKPAASLEYGFVYVKNIEPRGKDEVVIHLKEPDTNLDTMLAQSGITEEAYGKAHASDLGTPNALGMGTGPFKYVKYVPDDEVVMTRNNNYWGPKPGIKTLTLKYIGDASSRLLAAEGHQIDGSFAAMGSSIQTYKRLPGYHLVEGQGSDEAVLIYNVNKPPFNDIHVRRAMALAINRSQLAQGITHGYGSAAVTLVTPTSASLLLGSAGTAKLYNQLNTYQYNVAAAKRELAQSAYPHGFSSTLNVSTDDPDIINGAQIVVQMLSKIGIHLTLKELPDSQYGEEVFVKRDAPGVTMDPFAVDGLDPMLRPNYLTQSTNSLNLSHYSNKANDAALAKMTQVPFKDKATRAQGLKAALTIENRDLPYIPLVFRDQLALVKDGLNLKGLSGFWWMERWTNQLTLDQ
jgi:peptide/nickel transport system substrate-binding protein